MKTGREYEMSNINYISSILKASLLYSWKYAILYMINAIFKWSMFYHHQKGSDCWLQGGFDDNKITKYIFMMITNIWMSYKFL